MNKDKLIIGTRGSELALCQTNQVKSALLTALPGLQVEIRTIQTTGDKILDTALSKIADKGLFTKEIENHLLDGSIDLAVHSFKDLPTAIPSGLTIAAIPLRADSADVLISKNNLALDQLPTTAVVLTGSLRRRAQLLNINPDLNVQDIRGNVPTRLRKLDESDAQALVIAAAGLIRLGLQNRITQRLNPAQFLPACGQGALALEIRADDYQTRQLVAALDDPESRTTATAERTVLHHLQGGCQIPIGAHAHITNQQLYLYALLSDLEGRRLLTTYQVGPPDQPESLGRTAAEHLLAQGGREIINQILPEPRGNIT